MASFSLTPSHIVRVVLVTGGIVLLAILSWQLSQVLLLAFGAVVVAAVLTAAGDFLTRWTRLPAPWSTLLALLLIVLGVAGFIYLLGMQLREQLDALFRQLPEMVAAVGDQFGIADLDDRLFGQVTAFFQSSSIFNDLAGYTTGIVGALASTFLVIVAGVYFALEAPLYREGALKLIPRQHREVSAETLDNAGRALRLWLFGQLLTMLAVGIVTGAALWIIGLPSALALGFIAGVMEFVPFVGPIIAAVPAIVIALSHEDPMMIFYVGAAYLLIQQLENNILVPLIQKRTVELPPVLGLFSLVAFGLLFGPLGVLLGTPLTVVLLVAVKQLYVREALDEETTIPGELSEEEQLAAAAAADVKEAVEESLGPDDELVAVKTEVVTSGRPGGAVAAK